MTNEQSMKITVNLPPELAREFERRRAAEVDSPTKEAFVIRLLEDKLRPQPKPRAPKTLRRVRAT